MAYKGDPQAGITPEKGPYSPTWDAATWDVKREKIGGND